jgi:hypothetical protein
MPKETHEIPPRIERDYRIDFFRGFALFLIFWDHNLFITKNTFPLYYLTPAYTMFADAAELFVILSGYVFGMVYQRLYLTKGALACCTKGIFRAWELYRANIITLILTLGVATFFYTNNQVILMQVDSFFNTPFDIIPNILTLKYIPFGFDILPLYITLLIIMPLLLVLYNKKPALAITLSAVLYLVAQIAPEINMPRYSCPS